MPIYYEGFIKNRKTKKINDEKIHIYYHLADIPRPGSM